MVLKGCMPQWITDFSSKYFLFLLLVDNIFCFSLFIISGRVSAGRTQRSPTRKSPRESRESWDSTTGLRTSVCSVRPNGCAPRLRRKSASWQSTPRFSCTNCDSFVGKMAPVMKPRERERGIIFSWLIGLIACAPLRRSYIRFFFRAMCSVKMPTGLVVLMAWIRVVHFCVAVG